MARKDLHATLWYVVPISALVYFGFYNRSGLSSSADEAIVGGGVIAAITAVGLGLQTLFGQVRRGKIEISREAYPALLTFAAGGIGVLISAISGMANSLYTIRMIAEICIVLSFYWVGYYVIRNNLLSVDLLAGIIIVVGLVAAMAALTSVGISQNSIRRLSASGGLNYTANTFALAGALAQISAFRFFRRRRIYVGTVLVAASVLCSAVVLLQGSRQATIALAIVMVTLLMSRYNRRIGLVIVFGFGVGVVLVQGYVTERADIGLLVQRYDWTHFSNTVLTRMHIYYSSLATDIGVMGWLFGRHDLYEVWDRLDIRTTHPHNIFISVFRYWGIASGVLLIGALVNLFYKMVKLWRFSHFTDDVVTLRRLGIVAIMMFISLMYVMFSGNFTRAFHFYLCWGVATGLLANISCSQFVRVSQGAR